MRTRSSQRNFEAIVTPEIHSVIQVFRLLIESALSAKYREDPRMMAALAAVFARAGDASPQELKGLLEHVKMEQGSVDYREMTAKK